MNKLSNCINLFLKGTLLRNLIINQSTNKIKIKFKTFKRALRILPMKT